MQFSQRTARIVRACSASACACLLAIAMAAQPACAYGSPLNQREYSMDIEAAVSDPPTPVVIKVEVPASTSAVDIVVRTSVLDGRFLGFQAAKTAIRNLEESTVPVRVTVGEVTDGTQGADAALRYLGVFLSADRTVELSEGMGKNDVVIEQLAPGSSADLMVSVTDRTAGSPIPEGTYGMSATLKVAAA